MKDPYSENYKTLMKEIELSLLADDMILYLENQNDSMKKKKTTTRAYMRIQPSGRV